VKAKGIKKSARNEAVLGTEDFAGLVEDKDKRIVTNQVQLSSKLNKPETVTKEQIRVLVDSLLDHTSAFETSTRRALW